MNVLEIILSFISLIGTISSISFAYLAFSRNQKKDIKDESKSNSQEKLTNAVDLATIKIDLKYTRDGIDRIGTRLDVIEKIQNKAGENIIKITEHLNRTDVRLDKVEKRLDDLEKHHQFAN